MELDWREWDRIGGNGVELGERGRTRGELGRTGAGTGSDWGRNEVGLGGTGSDWAGMGVGLAGRTRGVELGYKRGGQIIWPHSLP